jgi:hypothetical protein
VGPVMGKEDDRDEERERVEREIEEQARLAFLGGTGERVRRLGDDLLVDDEDEGASRADPTSASERASMAPPPLPTFQRQAKKKKDFAAALGIKNAAAGVSESPVASVPPTVATKPAGPLVGYGSDSDSDD